MRLLKIKTFEFEEFNDANRPKYVIASHRWVEGSEVTLEDVRKRRNADRSGYRKIVDFAKYVHDHVPGVEWLWVDTCCINKDSDRELSEAINLMFHWYRSAELCIAFLADVGAAEDVGAFERSDWFNRGWTLQELLAPRVVVFVTKTWGIIGNKGASTHGEGGTRVGRGIEMEIARITGIPVQALHNFETSLGYTIDERLKWMENRSTTLEEDMSYALYGIFGVTLGANYGEKHTGARRRLKEALYHESERFHKIVGWLSPPDPWTNHNSARELHEPETGTWLLGSTQFLDWKAATNGCLWVYGKAGCSKTVLCSTVIEDVKGYCEGRPRAGYAVFYFSFSDNRKQHLIDLLLSLVVQLGWKGPALLMLQQAFDKPGRNSLGIAELENILLACFKSYDETFLLIDALDECPDNGDIRLNVLQCLVRLSQKGDKVKIFTTSRNESDIHAAMESLGAVSMPVTTSSVNLDILRYVVTQLSSDHRLARLDQETKDLIHETVSDKADGMFRWAYCLLLELKKLKLAKPSFVQMVLSSFPATLDETYERMLMKIGEDLRPDALTLLRWLAYSERPLTLSELMDATIIDLTRDGDVEFGDRPAVDDTLEFLSGLVITVEDQSGRYEESEDSDTRSEFEKPEDDDHQNTGGQHQLNNTKVRLAHFSVKEYLESKRILEGSAREFHLESGREHAVLSQSCVVYLTHYSSSDERMSNKQDLKAFPLLLYAAKSWFYHTRLQSATDVPREAHFLRSTEAVHDWLHVFEPDRTWVGAFAKVLDDAGSSLYYAAALYLETVVDELLRAGVDVHAQGGYYGNALQAASAGGNEKVVQLLIGKGAEVNAQGGEYGNALQAASFYGIERVVQLLIGEGAEINAQEGPHGDALQAASFYGNERVVQLLIDKGAEINAQGGPYGNALQAASFYRNERVVQLLIDEGAEINAQGGPFGDALQAAIYGLDEMVVQLLLNAGARAESDHLEVALGLGHDESVQLLSDAGAALPPGSKYEAKLKELLSSLKPDQTLPPPA